MKPLLRILIIDDSPDDAALIIRELQHEFAPVHERVETAAELVEVLAYQKLDAIISDFVMPQFNGLHALKIVQESKVDVPFLMVSGKIGEDVAVEAMKSGAHDFLLKDNLARLVPAIKRELKEAEIRRERIRAQEALQSSQIMFRSLVEQSLVGIYIIQDDKFSYTNPKMGEIFGYTQEELITKKRVFDLVAEGYRDDVADKINNRLGKSVKSIHYTFQGKKKDCSLIEVEAHGTKMEFNGKPSVIGTLLDITERKHAEEELRKLSRAVEQSPVSVVITNTEGIIEYVNPKFTTVTGYNCDEVIGKNPRILKSGLMDPEIYRQLWENISGGGEWHGEFQNRKKDGEIYWESASISAIKNSDGIITHFVGVKEDITERKRDLEHLRQAQKMEAIGQLAGGISHDFNNLLTIINGYSTLMLRALKKDDPMRKEAEQILHAGERAADLTRQLLAFSRRQFQEPKILNINSQVQNLEKMLCRVLGEHIDLITNLSTDIGFIKADPGQIEQIIMNLVVNARDALERGGSIIIATYNADIDEQFAKSNIWATSGNYVVVEVKDSGMGMSDEVKRRIFEPFFTTKEQGKGTGLGLATVYGIVNQNGGFIKVESEPEQGSSFKIYLPRIYEQPIPIQRSQNKISLTGDQTILIVEDEIGVLNLVVSTLRKQGYRVLHSNSPYEAMEIFKQHQNEIELLLTDVAMPFMSGPKLAEQLQTFKPSLKVVFMSGHTSDAVMLQQIQEKGLAFLSKPFVDGALVNKIGMVLGNRIETVELAKTGTGGKS